MLSPWQHLSAVGSGIRRQPVTQFREGAALLH